MDSLLEPVAVSGKQEFCVEMMKRLDFQRRNERFCDVILEVGSGDDKARLKAHKIVLCAASPFFDNALNSDMKEKKEGVIRLEQTSKALMEEVLEYVYTGYVDVNEHNTYNLIAAGDYFLIPSLKDFSATFILQNLCDVNCIFQYYSGIKYRCEKLQKGAWDFICANFETVTKSEEFFNLNVEQVEEWISSDEIIVDGEERVFEIILRWFEADGRRNQQVFFDLLRHVRCVYVPHDYLFNVMLPHPLVKENSSCSTLILDAVKTAFSGTGECFFSLSPRNCLKTHEDAIFTAVANENLAFGTFQLLCYLPSLNEWRQLNLDEIQRQSSDHFMTTYHGKLYLMGNSHGRGFGRLRQIAKFAQRYDPTLNQWEPIQVPEKVFRRFAAVTFQGFLFVIGGENENRSEIDTVQKYNPETNKWIEVSPLSSPRSNICAVADGSYMYAIGGNGYLDTVQRFEPRKNMWETLPSVLTGRQDAGAATINQKVFVFGGLHRESTVADAIEMYDSVTGIWSGIPSIVAPRGRTSAVRFKGKIYVLGCFQNEQGQQEDKQCLKVYDTDNNKWDSCRQRHISGDSRCTVSCIRILSNVVSTYCKL